MRWSKLKHLLEERFAASIRGRISINQARYRYTREEVGRIWVSIDGVEIAAFDTSTALRRRYDVASELMDINSEWGSSEAFGEADAKACELLREAGEYSDYAAAVDLEEFLSQPIEVALTSPSPLLRALAVADGRVGKRRLRDLKIGPLEHPLVRKVFELRCTAEGIQRPLPAA